MAWGRGERAWEGGVLGGGKTSEEEEEEERVRGRLQHAGTGTPHLNVLDVSFTGVCMGARKCCCL